MISKDTIDKSKVIEIKGKIITNQNNVYINASGLIDKQKRKAKSNRGDGVVYFWTNTHTVYFFYNASYRRIILKQRRMLF